MKRGSSEMKQIEIEGVWCKLEGPDEFIDWVNVYIAEGNPAPFDPVWLVHCTSDEASAIQLAVLNLERIREGESFYRDELHEEADRFFQALREGSDLEEFD